MTSLKVADITCYTFIMYPSPAPAANTTNKNRPAGSCYLPADMMRRICHHISYLLTLPQGGRRSNKLAARAAAVAFISEKGFRPSNSS